MLFSKQPVYFLLLLSFLITGCSSVSKADMQDFFRTEIRANDAKMFTFTVIVARQNIDNPRADKQNGQGKKGQGAGNKGGGNGNSPQSQNSKKNDENKEMTELFEQLLTERLEENQYCRKGYIDLSRSFSGTIFTLRGECHESATAEDRNNFL